MLCKFCIHWERTDKEFGDCVNPETVEEQTMQHESCTLYEGDYKRRCDECGEVMAQGFCIDDGSEYYCTEECLHKHISPEEWIELYDDGNSTSYWTEWEDYGDET